MCISASVREKERERKSVCTVSAHEIAQASVSV